jgi:hypothetical protein
MTTTERESIQETANRHYGWFQQDRGRKLRLMVMCQDRQHHEWADAIREDMLEDPLCVSLWEVSPNHDEAKWEILLGTGGPAVRILVTTDLGGAVQEADYQYQDWFKPWTSAERQNRKMVEEYADLFYYGVVAVTVDGCEAP